MSEGRRSAPARGDTIAIAADHAGVALKSALAKELEGLGYRVIDLGTNSPDSVDYPDYADAVYNLAALEYDAGHLSEARHYWSRYLELDSTSEWAKKASRGIQLVDLTLNAERKRGA